MSLDGSASQRIQRYRAEMHLAVQSVDLCFHWTQSCLQLTRSFKVVTVLNQVGRVKMYPVLD
jgi:hypothetical protein